MNFTTLTDQPILAYCIALGVGLLIGAERERSKGVGPTRSAMGIRTFSTTSLLGAVSLMLGGSTLLAVMALAVAGLAMIAYLLSHEQDPGLTTEVALLLTFLLGGLAMREPASESTHQFSWQILMRLRGNSIRDHRMSISVQKCTRSLGDLRVEVHHPSSCQTLAILRDSPRWPQL